MHLNRILPAIFFFFVGSAASAAVSSRKPLRVAPIQKNTPVQKKAPVQEAIPQDASARKNVSASEGTSTLDSTAGQPQLPTQELVATTLTPASPAPDSITPEPPTPEPSKQEPPPFSKKFGLGLSAIPAQVLFFPKDSSYGFVYTGGMQIDFYGRLHPKVTLEFSLAGLGWTIASNSNSYYAEFSTSLGTRLFFYRKQVKPSFSIHPYVVTALRLHTQARVIHDSPLADVIVHHVLFGFVPGIGVEFRWKEKLGFHVDIRTFLGATLYPWNAERKFVTGISATLGAGYYF